MGKARHLGWKESSWAGHVTSKELLCVSLLLLSPLEVEPTLKLLTFSITGKQGLLRTQSEGQLEGQLGPPHQAPRAVRNPGVGVQRPWFKSQLSSLLIEQVSGHLNCSFFFGKAEL